MPRKLVARVKSFLLSVRQLPWARWRDFFFGYAVLFWRWLCRGVRFVWDLPWGEWWERFYVKVRGFWEMLGILYDIWFTVKF